MDRRGFIKSGAAMGAAAALHARAASGRQPNVILITADDQGWREMSCAGNHDLSTPALDRLAAGGVRFTNAFVTSPSCSASRSSIITGQAPHSVHVLGLTHVHRRYQMSKDVPTMPRALERAGYATAIQGKWHVATFKNTRSYGYKKRMSIIEINHSEKAKAYISSHRKRPFYLELNFIQPHRPEGDHAFKQVKNFPVDPDSIHVPGYYQIPDWPEIRKDMAAYYSQIMEMDRIIGEILDHLDREGLAENTIIVFVSDNGAPYPGCKTTCYDRGIGVPMIVRWPAAVKAGLTTGTLASTVDIMPTVLEACGVPVPDPVQGRSLLPVARGESSGVNQEIFAEVTYHVIYTPMRAIRTGEWKYIENLSPDPTGLDQCVNMDWAKRVAKLPGQRCCVLRPAEELYYLTEDPDEKLNLADDPAHASVKQDLVARLHSWRERTHDPFPDLS